MALEALKDLFISNLLPDARRLVPFEARPLLEAVATLEASSEGGDKGINNPGAKKAGTALLMWYFEDRVGGWVVGSVGWANMSFLIDSVKCVFSSRNGEGLCVSVCLKQSVLHGIHASRWGYLHCGQDERTCAPRACTLL